MSDKKQIIIHTDGASRGNPGLAGVGISINIPELISQTDPKEYNLAIFLGTKTNNEAEYLGLLAALKFMAQLVAFKWQNKELTSLEVVIKMDSMLVVKQMNGEWKIKEERMQKLVQKCREVESNLPFQVKYEHVTRDHNETADWLANQSIDLSHQD